jgi:hypothetical protein
MGSCTPGIPGLRRYTENPLQNGCDMGREPQTVQAMLRSAKQMISMWQQVGIAPTFPALGPFPVGGSFGMKVAIAMLLKSLEPGRYHDSYQQFETI